MNQIASAPGASLLPDSTPLFTAGQFAITGLLALLVIVGLIWGIRLARRRKLAEREVRTHNAEIEAKREEPQPERRSGEDRREPPPAAPEAPPAYDSANASTELLFDPIPDATARVDPPEAPVPDAAPAIAATPAIEPGTGAMGGSGADGPVTQLKGLGPKLAQKLAEQGITTVGQIAALTDDEAAALDARLGPFTGRMARDRWQEQARFLAAGDRAGFEAVFGRL